MKLSLPPALLSILVRGSANSCANAFTLGKASITRAPSSAHSSFSSLAINNRLRGGHSSSALNMSAERPFKTWTFDGHCETMDWSPAPEASLAAVSAAEGDVSDADLVIVGVLAPAKDDKEEKEDDEEEKEMEAIAFTGKAAELDESLGGALADLAAENAKAFQNGGAAGTATPAARIVSGGKAKRYILLGLGAEDTEKGVESATITKVGGAVASACHDQKKVASCNVLLPPQIEGDAALKDLSTAFYSGLYADNRFRTGKKVELKAEDVKEVKLFMEGSADGAASAIETGARLAKGVSLTRDIVNAPHNVLNSESLADTARRIAEESGGSITCEILGKEECEKRGMGSYLGVARGSETEPQFIHLTYKPKDGVVKKKVGCVGKGLLFDTGGYNIKTAMMELMKFDCGGSAAVLGAARAVGDIQPPGVEAHFIVAACENMINARAVVPSDILTASNGKTIEVLNTDAEGRLTLADALVFADKECGCESIIELSTLTGACMISLGKQVCGVWTDDDDLAKDLEDISKVTGDKSWRMPLVKEYAEELKSKVADMTNLGGRYGGAITAALFLTEFVDKKKPFAHIDIAGPVWDDKSGATGFGAKLVTEWVRRSGE
eukprot:CAMPEP_0172553454 /NCGR_PEP_ID=MMETSP1067-20121228/51021_1 /TAXON_ID=265564 ORGANISM="Thalassiosira punctigera, Strain Tpunct2005C2" /NCGR_SAMPLE_ID=MMETSP1067 /ASSEMBLY_ACC=CAM_ASM_000444 /LENGTH=611 /DNA_ID=CAMNT_0013341647 /DNA_START=143 /DNA_END=1978 /DNA_ORIENTATION=+